MARCEVFWEYLGGSGVGIEREVGVCMTNQPEEIEEEKTVPVKVQTNRELVWGCRHTHIGDGGTCPECGAYYNTRGRLVSHAEES